jgi:hypothetical protein
MKSKTNTRNTSLLSFLHRLVTPSCLYKNIRNVCQGNKRYGKHGHDILAAFWKSPQLAIVFHLLHVRLSLS